MKVSLLKSAITFSVLPFTAQATIVTFDDLTLAVNSNFNPALAETLNGGGTAYNYDFTSGGVTFTYNFTDFGDFGNGPCCWNGFTYSNETDTTTPGAGNDRAAITGDGNGTGQDNYGIATGFGGAAFNFASAVNLTSIDLTNTTYTYLAMRDGSGFNTAFVDNNDFFEVIINGLNGSGDVISSTSFELGRGLNLLDTWENVNLALLGTVNGIQFNFNGSSTGIPYYVAFDNLEYQAVPVPQAFGLFMTSLLGLTILRKKNNQS